MRTTTRYRLAYLLSIIPIYSAGFYWLPDTLQGDNALTTTLAFATTYFILLPAFYWFAVIHKGQQKLWKMLLPLSLSALVARYSFPSEISQYFEVIAWAKYPVFAVLIALEFYLFWTVIRGLWQARHLRGDPRIHAYRHNQNSKKGQLELALLFAYEPANWYYAIPRLSRNHPQALAGLRLRSASAKWLLVSGFICCAITVVTYLLLLPYSHVAAI